tara:strand:+ start:19 stop:216 length:198 start_codon:yes stop_codon:yes gene_type:complete
MKTKFEEYVNEIDKLIRDYTKKIHIAELEQICDSIEDSPAGTGKMDFWLEDIVDNELDSRKTPSE